MTRPEDHNRSRPRSIASCGPRTLLVLIPPCGGSTRTLRHNVATYDIEIAKDSPRESSPPHPLPECHVSDQHIPPRCPTRSYQAINLPQPVGHVFLLHAVATPSSTCSLRSSATSRRPRGCMASRLDACLCRGRRAPGRREPRRARGRGTATCQIHSS